MRVSKVLLWWLLWVLLWEFELYDSHKNTVVEV